MKSILIMFVALGIAGFGVYRMWQFDSVPAGVSAGKPWLIVGGVILFGGMLLNHWEHTRRNGD